MTEGELQKRIEELTKVYTSEGKYIGVKELDEYEVLEIVEEMKKEMPNPEEIQMALAQLLNFIPKTDVREHIRKHLEKEYNATWKWLGRGEKQK